MLFNSYVFIFIFLPICLIGFLFLSSRFGKEPSIAWLVLCSLFFYGWWNPVYLLLIIASMLFNFYIGKRATGNKAILTFGIATNLCLLGYFKYANFFVFNLNQWAAADIQLSTIILPLAISFFTFQQIAYLVDSYRGITHEYSLLHYALFITFFPQLIAGPIVHHKDMLPQFMDTLRTHERTKNIAIGASIFAIGLFKKTVLADGIAPYANTVFDDSLSGNSPSFFVAWGGALAYTLQLYFDFSGYSDMAIGLARMFGIILPLNFYSPYKATNISEFWRRWHITLSNFLRDYVYIALGGNRSGTLRRYQNLLFTMLLGGLWHGAGWNFILWGGLHGLYLVGHQVWMTLHIKLPAVLGWLLTFMLVIIGWVFFRAESLGAAQAIIEGMFGLNGIALPNAIYARLGDVQQWLSMLGVQSYLGGGESFLFTWLWVFMLLPIVLFLPNTQDLFFHHKGTLSSRCYEIKASFWPLWKYVNSLYWQANAKWAIFVAVALTLGLLTLSQVSEFLYFQF